MHLNAFKLVREVAERHRFLHWELEFADVFVDRGGVDLMLGNPPWIKVEWNEGAVLGDVQPLYALRDSSAPQLWNERINVRVELPGCFLNASAVLERQFTAFVFDRWVEGALPVGALPRLLAQVLESVEKGGPPAAFPWNFLAYFDLHRSSLEQRFLGLFEGELSQSTRERLLEFSSSEDGLRYRLVEGLRRRAEDLKKWRGRVRTLNQRIRELRDIPMQEEERKKEEDELAGKVGIAEAG